MIESFLDDHSFYKHVYDVYQKVKEHKCAFKLEPFTIIMEDNVFNRRKFIFLGCVIITIPERFNIENVLLPIVNSKKRVTFMQIKGHVHDGTKLAYYNNEADMLAGEYRQIGLELHYSNVGKKNKKAKKFWKNHGGNGGYGM